MENNKKNMKKLKNIYVWKVVVNKGTPTQREIYHDYFCEAQSKFNYLSGDIKLNARLEKCGLLFSLKYRLNKYFKLDY